MPTQNNRAVSERGGDSGVTSAFGRAAWPDLLLAQPRSRMTDVVEKVENRKTPKISRKSFFSTLLQR